jgi:hypothetical protein
MLGGRRNRRSNYRRKTNQPPVIRLDSVASILGRLLGIVVLLWFLFVCLPEIFHGIFHTLLGNIMLVLIVLLNGLRSPVFALVLAVLFFFLYRFSHRDDLPSLARKRESFVNWIQFPKKYEGSNSKKELIPGLSPSLQEMIEKGI